jgi:hypothetical protein
MVLVAPIKTTVPKTIMETVVLKKVTNTFLNPSNKIYECI